MKLTNNVNLGTYSILFEIFGYNGSNIVTDGYNDRLLFYNVEGDPIINDFNHDWFSNYAKAYIIFNNSKRDVDITLQFRYYGSSNSNFKFLFFSRCVKGVQKTGFDHTVLNIHDVQDNHKILYFENLNLNGNLIDGLGDPKYLDSATNKKYVDTENIRQDIAIADKASKVYVDGEIGKVSVDTTPLLPRDGSRSMTGDLDMDENRILCVKNLNDYKVDDAYEVRVRDLGSVVNKEYLNEKFLKVDKDGNYFNLKQNTIKNCEPYYDGLFDNNSLVSKAFVDAEISKLPKPATDVLKLGGSKAMTGALDMNNNEIKNLKDPVNDQDAATQKWVGGELSTQLNLSMTYTDTQFAKKLDLTGGIMAGDINMVNSHKIINSPNPSSDTDLVTKKYMETHVSNSHVTSSDRSNAFNYVMANPSNLIEEDDIEFGNWVTFQSSPHSINKKVIDTKLIFDADHGYYSSRASINLYALPNGSYTMAFELMWSSDDVDRDTLSLNGISAIETIHDLSNKTFDNYSRWIMQFSKYTYVAPNHLYVDIVIKMKTGKTYPSKLQTYIVCYGVFMMPYGVLIMTKSLSMK